MNKQIRQRTWKYFRQQKWEEVSQVLLTIFIIVSIAGLLFQIGWVCEGAFEGDGTCIEPYETTFSMWVLIGGLITTGIWIIIGLVVLINLTIDWIQTNWKEAKEKAKKDFK